MTADLGSASRSDCAPPGGPACSRRELLEALALAGACGLALAGGVALPACFAPDPLEEALRGFFRDRAAARAVGVEVLALEPKRARSEDLVARVVRDRAPQLRELARTDPQRLGEALRAQHRDDFAQGRVAVVRGWVLSETESALLALQSI